MKDPMDNWEKLQITLWILWPFVVGWIIYRKHSSSNRRDDNHQNNHHEPQMQNKKNFRDHEPQMQNKKNLRDYYSVGRKLQREEKYDDAIKSFNNALIEAKDVFEFKDVFDRIGECYYGAKDFHMSIFWFNKSLELPIRNLDALEWRYKCLKELKLYIEAYQDATIYNELYKKTFSITGKWIDFELDDILKKAAMIETDQFYEENVLSHSNLRYARFYSSFDKIIPQDEQNQSELAWILKSKSYDKLLEFFFGKRSIENKQNFISKYGTKGLFSYDLIHCTCQYLRGRYDDCVKILENPKTELELVFFEYVKLYLDNNDEHTFDFKYKFKDFKNKKNPTVRFWFAKYCHKNIYISYHDYCNVLQSIKRGKPFVYAEILRNYNRRASDKFEKLEKEALRKFGHDEHILIECCKRYIFLKDKDNLLRILNIMDKDSAAYMFYTGMYHSISGDQIRKIYALKKTIETDSTFYKAYFHFRLDYGDKDSGLALQYLNDSLKIVSCYDEAYTSIKEIIRIENIQKVNRNKQKYDK